MTRMDPLPPDHSKSGPLRAQSGLMPSTGDAVDRYREEIRERRGKPRPDMPWVEDPGEIDAEFLEFVKSYPVQGRPRVQKLLRRYSQKEIHVFEGRAQAEAFLKRLF